MNFNHLLPRNELISKCVADKHYFLPTSHIEATLGYIAVRFRCKNCNRLATVFLSEEEYRINENIIKKFGEIK